jgi:NADH dehydrogenase [ubiquinone] 1 alpha subcomplex assembly factor 5
MTGVMTVFDRALVRRHRERAAGGFAAHDFLFREVATRLVERLGDAKRGFPLALDLGCRGGAMAEALRGQAGIQTLFGADLSFAMARAAGLGGLPVVVADEEFLPFAPASLNLVVSALSLHWVNDLPGALVQIFHALKPEGLFQGAMLGGETLRELRQSLLQAELEIEGGVSPRLSPLAEVRDAGNLLQRAGFAQPIADIETITVTYPNPLALMQDLRAMAETNANLDRRKGLARRATFLRAAALYQDRFAGADGRIPATFQVIFLAGWRS